MIDTVKEKLPFHEILGKFREKLRSLAEENGADILDLQKEFNSAQKQIAPYDLATDGIHPTNLGHRVIEDAVMKYFN